MHFEQSAGGVVVAKKGDKHFVLLLKDKSNKWTFPKGLIEKGEEKEKAAEREIGEETGIKTLKLLKSLTPIEYFYRWEGDLRKKTVYYFLFAGDADEKGTPQREEGIQEIRWIPIDEAMASIGYPKTNKKILMEAKQVVAQLAGHA
ncbi:NUDIX domain-containing protein [Candidatus Microgenomates bacterium]|nr:MAG: NUDIX domain-containing protein [Candidatus Microgenomates bacterium]